MLSRNRIAFSRGFLTLVFVYFLVTGHLWREGRTVEFVMEDLGFVLVLLAALGRLWSALYISGQKNRTLATVGPYSVTRNPLYVFSLAGAIGIGLATESLVVTVLILLFYIPVYHSTIHAEERKLAARFGEEFERYRRQVPRFIPNPRLYRDREQCTVNAHLFQRAILEAACFPLLFGLIEIVNGLHQQGALPVLFRTF